MAANNTTKGVSFEIIYSNLPLVIISIFGVASNLLLLIAFLKDPLKCFRNSGTYLVMNLSIFDCLTCLFVPFSHAVIITAWHPIFGFLVAYLAFGSFVSILSVSIDRFLMVTYPIKHRILINGKIMVLWLVAIWIVSFFHIALRLFDGLKGNDEISNYLIGAIVITLSAVMYASTYYKLKKQSRNIALQNSNESRAQEIRILKEKRFLKTIILIACIAFISVVPSLVFFQIFADSLDWTNDNLVFVFFMCILNINFAVNPFVYLTRLPNYRKTFYMLYCRRAY